ncbi:hypothetical protein L798_07325 [Zootermopsis nevadensis]|uniref:Uncharacterized protein n=1 Tax=Zootermopsis nevadensis TaxID=136037 RepID=A0A067RFF3_ZOONE|nr:hypothetical protein L798_07325 [Zootermopsis nevadensis]
MYIDRRCCSLCVVRPIKPQRVVTVFCRRVMKHRRGRYEGYKWTCRLGTTQRPRYIRASLCCVSETSELRALLPGFVPHIKFVAPQTAVTSVRSSQQQQHEIAVGSFGRTN